MRRWWRVAGVAARAGARAAAAGAARGLGRGGRRPDRGRAGADALAVARHRHLPDHLDDPADRLGMLDGQRMRAARVVLDIGVHRGKPRLDGVRRSGRGWVARCPAHRDRLQQQAAALRISRRCSTQSHLFAEPNGKGQHGGDNDAGPQRRFGGDRSRAATDRRRPRVRLRQLLRARGRLSGARDPCALRRRDDRARRLRSSVPALRPSRP